MLRHRGTYITALGRCSARRIGGSEFGSKLSGEKKSQPNGTEGVQSTEGGVCVCHVVCTYVCMDVCMDGRMDVCVPGSKARQQSRADLHPWLKI